MAQTHVAVVGATGLFGRQVVEALADAKFPTARLTLLASERSAGDEVDYGDDTMPVELATPEALRNMGVVVLATPPEASAPYLAAAKAQGARTIVPGDVGAQVVWPGAALPQGPLGLPSPVALAAALVLERLQAKEAEVVALVPASSAGRAGVELLERQTASLLNAKEPTVSVFPHRLAFNLIPEVAGEARAQAELLSKLPGCATRVTAVQTPHFHGLMLVVTARLASPASPVEVRARFQGASGLKLVDDVPQHVYPMPMLAVSDGAVLVGRLEVEGPRVRLVAAVDPLVQLGQAAARLAVSLAGG